MVLKHITQHTGLIIVVRAAADGAALGHADLHMIDVGGIPDRLKQRIGETEHEDVLHRLLAEIMVDAINLLFAEMVAEGLIQLPRRGQIAAKRFFDHQSSPTGWRHVVQPYAPSWVMIPGYSVGETAR